jgi:hypothetical protein
MKIAKQLSLIILPTLMASSFAQVAPASTDPIEVTPPTLNASQPSENATKDLNVNKIFGVNLGQDTMADIKPIVISSKVITYGDLSVIGKEISISERDGTMNDAIKFIEFSTSDGKFTAVTLDEKIIELQVHGEWERWWIGDQSLIPSLRGAFEKKYKKLRDIKLVQDDTYFRRSVRYELWRENSGAFTVVIKESRPKVKNKAACFSYLNEVRRAGLQAAQLEARCSGLDNPEFELFYRVEADYARAYAIAKEGIDKKVRVANEAANEAKRKEISKY